MRTAASILHLDLDAFFAAVEQRDKPSLRGKPVVVGGLGPRGVVSTASYEARVYGARSAMPMSEARRLCPGNTAYLSGRFAAYRRSAAVVRETLLELSPVIEPVSLDEAYVDLSAGTVVDFEPDALERLAHELVARVAARTGGLTCSVGVGTSKLVAKVASDFRKPAGVTVIPAGTEQDFLAPLPVRTINGVGPVTEARLATLGAHTVAQLAQIDERDLVSVFGAAHGSELARLARAEDSREVESDRETKSVSAEETFAQDVHDRGALQRELDTIGTGVVTRMLGAGLFARTVTVKVRRPDFSIVTRSATFAQPVGEASILVAQAQELLGALDIREGVRLLGFGVSGFAEHSQGVLWEPEVRLEAEQRSPAEPDAPPGPVWSTGADVCHEAMGAGWVWGSGLGLVTVRFEGPRTGPGPIRTFRADDPALSAAEPPEW